MKVSFCGHRELSERAAVEAWLAELLPRLIEQGAEEFLLGGYGAFDELAAAILIKLRAGGAPIRILLVAAYLDRAPRGDYDEVIFPGIETVPPRLAIIRRNEWMVDSSDILAAYVSGSIGGAARTLEYARRRRKKVILFPNTTSDSAPNASF